MRFVVLAEGRSLRVVAHVPDGQGEVSDLEGALADLKSHGGPVSKAVTGMLATFALIAEHGRIKSARHFHEANKAQSIYEFSKGDIRVYFYFSSDGQQLVVCSHAIVKKRQAAKSSDVDRVITLRNRMDQATKSGKLVVFSREKKS